MNILELENMLKKSEETELLFKKKLTIKEKKEILRIMGEDQKKLIDHIDQRIKENLQIENTALKSMNQCLWGILREKKKEEEEKERMKWQSIEEKHPIIVRKQQSHGGPTL